MGQTWSSWYNDLVPYEPSKYKRTYEYLTFYIVGYYGARHRNQVEYFYCKINDPESLLHELLLHDMVGMIVGEENLPASSQELYIFGEDEIDASILTMPTGHAYNVVYPEKYKGHVPYYIGCDRIRSGEYRRPRKINAVDSHRDRECGGDNVPKRSVRGWNVVDKKRA
ncbi:hypothetical protein TWF481_007401 [Arthrobotrys musiformis]|uniref:Uncharacterized protein n=1 Tax=Arthrobotrys musiformis TaxID=47236 RepID=A0AAV9WBC0_9PEZI